MLIEAYIEALLVDEELADLVWEGLEQGRIEEDTARAAWLAVAITTSVPDTGNKLASARLLRRISDRPRRDRK